MLVFRVFRVVLILFFYLFGRGWLHFTFALRFLATVLPSCLAGALLCASEMSCDKGPGFRRGGGDSDSVGLGWRVSGNVPCRCRCSSGLQVTAGHTWSGFLQDASKKLNPGAVQLRDNDAQRASAETTTSFTFTLAVNKIGSKRLKTVLENRSRQEVVTETTVYLQSRRRRRRRARPSPRPSRPRRRLPASPCS